MPEDFAPGFERIGRFFVFKIAGVWIATPTQHGIAPRKRSKDRQEIIDHCMAESPEIDLLWPVRKRKRQSPKGWLLDVG